MKYVLAQTLVMALLWTWHSSAMGGAVSANYQVAMDALDSGGQQQASQDYGQEFTLGGIGGSSTVTNPSIVARHNYVGQLYDPVELVLSASSTNVNEGATRTLNAEQVMDDATMLSVNSSAVAWSNVSGPIASISAGGLLTADSVYQHTPATAGGSHMGASGLLNMQVLNVGNDDFGLYSGDDVDDLWQVQFFGENNTNGAAGADSDTDGQANDYEFIVGTIPTSSASRLRFAIASSGGPAGQPLLVLDPVFSNRTYEIQFGTNLIPGTFAVLPGATESNVGSTLHVSDPAASEAIKVYRAHISYP